MTRMYTGLAVIATIGSAVHAQEIWSGRTFLYDYPGFGDTTLPENQDRITDNVWITRAVVQGIFNAKTEPFYAPTSPADTEWATGNAVDYASLTFDEWVIWHANNPPGTVGVDAVVHLISEDIYVDIRFTGWGVGPSAGGRFSYLRAERPSCPADLNGDGMANGIDVGLFLQAYANMQPAGDFNGDGMWNGIDVGLFLQAYSAGC